jgi:short-subunit dehydrogenase
MSKRNLRTARVIVTGASSGIGRETALELARHGSRLVLTARRQERLTELKAEVESLGGTAAVVPGDITDGSLRQEVVERAVREFGGLDVLVNNAGIGAIGVFASADAARLRRVMEVNFFAVVEMTRIALPLLRQGERPIIVNISSVLAHRAVPRKSEYCASKFAVHGFSDALRAELVEDGIDVLLVSPSTTASEFFAQVIDRDAKELASEAGAMSPREVARQTVKAIRRGKHEIILSSGGRMLVWLDRLWPALANRIVARFG